MFGKGKLPCAVSCNGKPCPHEHDRKVVCQGLEHQAVTRWKCAYGDYSCYQPFECHYEYYADRLVAGWTDLDADIERADWEYEQKRMHSLGEPFRFARGRFGTISREIFYSQQPSYYIVALSLSGITLKPFAKVRLPNSYVNLYVELGTAINKLSKNARRKAVRYGHALPIEIRADVDTAIKAAIDHYLTH